MKTSLLFIILSSIIFMSELAARFAPQINKHKPLTATVKQQATEKELQKQKQTLNFIQRDYAPFINTYKRIKTTCSTHHRALTEQLLGSIYQAAAFNNLRFYGNFFSKCFRYVQLDLIENRANPLRAFESIYLTDAIGHIHKHCANKGTLLDQEADNLIALFSELQSFIRSTTDYSIELLRAQRRALKNLQKTNIKYMSFA